MVNLENINAHLIGQGMEPKQRLLELNKIARSQLQSFLSRSSGVKKLENMNPGNKKLRGDANEE